MKHLDLQDSPGRSGRTAVPDGDPRPRPELRDPIARLRPGVRIVAIAGIAVVLAVAIRAIAGDGPGPGTSAADPAGPRLIQPGQLAAIGGAIGHPVFWAGRKKRSRLEFSDDGSGNVHLRYLTGKAEVGDPVQRYLYVGTYPFTGAFKATRALAASDGLRQVRSGNGIGFLDPSRPFSVVIAWPTHPDLQVEVYDPVRYRALKIVRAGDIVSVP